MTGPHAEAFDGTVVRLTAAVDLGAHRVAAFVLEELGRALDRASALAAYGDALVDLALTPPSPRRGSTLVGPVGGRLPHGGGEGVEDWCHATRHSQRSHRDWKCSGARQGS